MGNNDLSHSIFNFISKIIDHYITYGQVKSDPELKKKSKMFGVRSIVTSILGMILIPLTVYGLLKMFGDFSIGYLLFIVVLVVLLVYEIFYCLIYGLLCTTAQLKLNRRAISWVALVLYVAMFVLVVYSCITFLQKVG